MCYLQKTQKYTLKVNAKGWKKINHVNTTLRKFMYTELL